MAKAISVAVIETVGGHGGADWYDFKLCRSLLDAGCRVSFYTCDETVSVTIPGLRFLPIYKGIYGADRPSVRAFRFMKGSFATLVGTITSGERICHMHLYGGNFAELALVLLLKMFGRKVVITVHDVETLRSSNETTGGIGSRASAKLKTAVIGLADHLIAHNEVSKAELVEKFGLPQATISVIQHGHHIEKSVEPLSGAEAKRAFGISATTKVVLFVGHIRETKGLDLLLEAIPGVAREVKDVVFLIAGRPWKSDFSPYQKLIDDLKIRDHCVLHVGFVPNEALKRYYSAADIVVLPYRKIYQSGVLIMAMSLKTPVLVSDLPSMTEIVSDGNTGYVFAQGSKDDLARQLIRALKDDSGRTQITEKAFDYMLKNHDWEQISERTLLLYRSILSEGQRG
jgi:glycosyltransferase involved in cell wall biosynthesis